MALKVAVLGATGPVGKEVLSIMAERGLETEEVYALSSRKVIGSEVSFGDATLKARDVEEFDFGKVNLCILATGDPAARKWGNKIAGPDCIVIDTSRAFRSDPQVPLIVPEVNAAAVEGHARRHIIACPDGVTAQLARVLKPLHEAAGVERAVVATYQSVSAEGQRAIDELWTQTKGIYVNQPPEPKEFPRQIAFNVIPQVDEFMDDGSTEEEWRIASEIRKIVDNDIQVTATCVRVPTFVGNGEAVHLELAEPLSAADARALLRTAPGIMMVDRRDEDEGYVTPVDSVGEWATFVSRVRDDPTVENGLAMWVVSDELHNGPALIAVQVAELLANRGVFSRAPAG
ncbi:MAG TPA: aspartate-semialdehyde dehydrogenase [Hyphomonadaceae bacterium]|nr:aspartate-semialdehyde dehydrogenase [Hyphomonadaceae bacterium]